MWSLPVYLNHITLLNSGLLTCVNWRCCHLWNAQPDNNCDSCIPIEKCVACVERLLQMQNVALSSTALPGRQHGHSRHLGQTALRNVTPVQSVISPLQLLSHLINWCGILLASAGPFGGWHSLVDPKPFFQNCE